MISYIIEKNLKSLILFGSHARGDHTIDSDVDLLGIEDSKNHTVCNVKSINLSLYSSEKSLSMCQHGDLFFLHIVTEGQSLFNNSHLHKLKSAFHYKNSYITEAASAYYLALKIFESQNEIINWPIANKRISWCVRTILIAISAENRSPIFSKSQLAKALANHNLSYNDAFMLIDAKNHKDKNYTILTLLKLFLDNYHYLKKEVNKKEFYTNGIVHSTIEAILRKTPNSYE
ncbi:TPA: nucleotidyltransferase domain-containing protein [Klebsiella aerogenes]|nr:nucleotidyltransferase domain-containing protein [Klebsiella aerogenes]